MAAMTDGTTRDHLVFSLDALLLRGIVRLLLDSAAAIVTGSAVVVARQLSTALWFRFQVLKKIDE